MIDGAAQDRIGRELRAMYEARPKGGIPERIWVLLLLIEHDEQARATLIAAAFPEGSFMG